MSAEAAGVGPGELKAVRGPTALGGGWRRFLDLLYLVAVTDFKKSYFGTVFGYAWSLVRPLALFGVLLFVFTQVVRFKGVDNYPVLLLFNFVLFGLFNEATSTAVTSVVAQEGIVRKTQFPRLVIPLAVVLTALFNFLVNLVAVLIFMLIFRVDPQWTWLLFPLIVGLVFTLTTTVSMLLSALYVRFRDTAIIWSVIAQALFYATPVIYPIEQVPERFHKFLNLNPLTPIFEQARHWIIDPSAPTAVDAAGGYGHLVAPIVIYITICVLGVWVFRREAPRIAEEL